MRFDARDIVLDTTRGNVGRITTINGACLVLTRPHHPPWDALTSWCMPATPAERQTLERQERGQQEAAA
ncbi:hypothetical protein [Streptomyces noursei]|uniref:hypothetical protein n=1 Tax=Streptomyces noursei TaxID=1971 RepID=UPI00167655D4|nr:hypothetical protein [Streptomyces noursei]MCZ1017725.1 hypothetical protein [Streptomyces noursei]GGX56697.1 hypothetical protein GCM10010341_91440 [Streptomyces noursei]